MLRKALVVLSFELLLAGCGRSPEPQAAAPTAAVSADQPAKPGTESPTIGLGNVQIQSGAGLSLPADFPKDIYLPASKSIENVAHLGPMTSVVLSLADPPASLLGDIQTQMKALGWKTAMSMQGGAQSSVLAFSKTDRSVMYSVSHINGQTQLSLQHIQGPSASP